MAHQNTSNRYQPRMAPPPSPAGSGDSLLAVPNIAALIALDSTLVDDGGEVGVKTVMVPWTLDKTSTDAVDGITIVAANPVGRWYRNDTVPSIWLIQDTWHINALTGDDENFGTTALLPLRTHAELMRRVHGHVPVPAAVTVYLDSAITEVCETEWMDSGATQIYYQGSRTVLYSGSISGVTVYNPAGGTDGIITDAGLPVSWTASGLVGEHIVLATGPNAGAVGIIAKDMAAKTARFCPMSQVGGFSTVNPAMAEQFDVYSLTQVNAFIINGTAGINILDVELVGPGTSNYTFVQHVGLTNFYGCTINGNIWIQGDEMVWCWNTRFGPDWTLQLESGALILMACQLEDFIDMGANRGVVSVELSSISQYTPAAGSGQVGGAKVQVLEPWGIFDNPPGTDYNYICYVGDLHTGGVGWLNDLLWGTGNAANYGVRVRGGAAVVYDTVPTVGPNVVADVIAGGVTCAYAALPVTDLNRMCGMVQS